MSWERFADRIAAVVDWFIHPSLRADSAQLNQARVFLISHLFGPFLGSAVPIALYLIDPVPGFEVAVLAVSIWGFWLFPFLLKRFGNYNWLAIISVENLIFCILWSCYFYGGINSPTLPWILTIPLLAFFYIGPSRFLRTVVITMFGVNVVLFLGLSLIYAPPPHGIPASNIETLGIISTIAVALYVTMMALYYAQVYKSQTELEAEMRKHLVTAAELREATAGAERASKAKAEFLAKMSHELRTPLNAVINYSQMLLEDTVEEGDEESINDLNRIHGAGHHLLKLINDVLDLSKIDAGMMGLHVEEGSIADIIMECIREIRNKNGANGNVVNADIEPGLPRQLIDRQKVEQIISQLLENAMKFTKDGVVNIRVSRVPGAAPDMLSIQIADTGIGIASHALESLFEQFTVLADASTSKYGGTGLGLALSLRLSRLMGGDIKVQSKLGEGSCFTILLPCDMSIFSTSNTDLPARAEADRQAPVSPPQIAAAA